MCHTCRRKQLRLSDLAHLFAAKTKFTRVGEALQYHSLTEQESQPL